MIQQLQVLVKIQLTMACAQLPGAFDQASRQENQAEGQTVWQELCKVHVSDIHLTFHHDFKSVFYTPCHYPVSLRQGVLLPVLSSTADGIPWLTTAKGTSWRATQYNLQDGPYRPQWDHAY